MAQWQPVTNLRFKLVHHPPVVVFFLCLLILAGAFIGIGIYSKQHDIKNPDISLDWNQILGSIASLRYCTDVNNTDLLGGKQEDESPLLLDHGVGTFSNASQDTRGVVHVSLLVPLVCTENDPSHNSISATLLGSQLGLKGVAGKELFNISLFLHLQSQISSTVSNSAFDPKLPTEAETKPSMSCLKISAPAHLLPLRSEPPECPANYNPEKDISPVRVFATESYRQDSDNASPCLILKFTPDPKLTVLLTQEEKALARYHLMLVSVVLLAVCSMMCLTGTLTCSRPRRHLANDLHFQKVTAGVLSM
ncbi:transmembrane protein 248 [Astyanax mexicanus]|uniref:transmembrane protein 248 n=1 Tax=Astyanax mexicanus TaxID=7994 RepID=UPI0020CAB17B|nr:transmembrane protein 248 [Astyanax mexicanus]